MKPKIVQIKGSNGSGKTTIVRQLIGKSSDIHLFRERSSRSRRVWLTVLDDMGWVVLGDYKPGAKMGGCDLFKTINDVKRAIQAARRLRPAYNVVFEGMMISTIKSTFYNYLRSMEDTIEPVFVILQAAPDACVARLAGRGTMKPDLKMANIEFKCAKVIAHAKEYQPHYVRWMSVDTISESAMLATFLELLS